MVLAHLLLPFAALLWPVMAFAVPHSAPTRDRAELLQAAVSKYDKFWDATADPSQKNISSRNIIACALCYCEAGKHPERQARLFELLRQMQDLDPKSKTYGNFRRNWNSTSILDYNAVEFRMQSATVIWNGYRDTLPAEARPVLENIMKTALEGCLLHKVKPGYTNIGLMNASNLILLGESLKRPDAAEKGYRRLDAVMQDMQQNGIQEYSSPFYYGVDLDDLLILETFAARNSEREKVRALLDLFWTDIAASWFDPAQRYAGANSRSYDYLHGHGNLDDHLWWNGWLTDYPADFNGLFVWLGKWQPPVALHESSLNQFPRLVRQTWGPDAGQVRTHYMTSDVTLSCSGACCGYMDMPLTVDLAGPPDRPRCYFIPDGRHDPYGLLKILDAGEHSKSLHLKPFFAGAQRETDALGVVVYRDADVPAGTKTLESHFVMPLAVDQLFIGGKPVELKKEPWTFPVKPGEAVTLRSGTAAIGLRIAWARKRDGSPAQTTLVYDGNTSKAMRLTVDHGMGEGTAQQDAAGAALWVRIGSQLKTDAAFTAWSKSFSEAKTQSQIISDKISIQVAGEKGPITVAAHAPFTKPEILDPVVSRVVLEMNGEDLGRRILDSAIKPTSQTSGH